MDKLHFFLNLTSTRNKGILYYKYRCKFHFINQFYKTELDLVHLDWDEGLKEWMCKNLRGYVTICEVVYDVSVNDVLGTIWV